MSNGVVSVIIFVSIPTLVKHLGEHISSINILILIVGTQFGF